MKSNFLKKYCRLFFLKRTVCIKKILKASILAVFLGNVGFASYIQDYELQNYRNDTTQFISSNNCGEGQVLKYTLDENNDGTIGDWGWICADDDTAEDFSLDHAYDAGGPGNGRIIDLDSGAVTLQGTGTVLELGNGTSNDISILFNDGLQRILSWVASAEHFLLNATTFITGDLGTQGTVSISDSHTSVDSDGHLQLGRKADTWQTLSFDATVDNRFEMNAPLLVGGTLTANTLDLEGGELINTRIENRTDAPTCNTANSGRLYHNTTSGYSYVCNGLSYVQIDTESSPLSPSDDGVFQYWDQTDQQWKATDTTLKYNATNSVLSLGDGTANNQTLFSVDIGATQNPKMLYNDDYYGYKGLIFENPIPNQSSLLSAQSVGGDAELLAITTDPTKQAGFNLYSDRDGVGLSGLRGWELVRQGVDADFEFNFFNSDTNGYPSVGQYTVLNIDGFDNTVSLPSDGTVLTGDGTQTNPGYGFYDDPDTGLYRITQNTIGFANNGNETLRLTADGTVAIGTTSVDNDLLVDLGGKIGATEYCNADGTLCRTFESLVSGGSGATETLPALQVRRTTDFTMASEGPWYSVPFDTTDIENDPSIIEHNNTQTEQIDIKEDGLYLIHYLLTPDDDIDTRHQVNSHVLKNGSVVLDGSYIENYDYYEEYVPTSVDVLAPLSAGDTLELQVQKLTNAQLINDTLLSVIKLEASQGPPGPAGAPGQDGEDGLPGGTTVDIQDHNAPVIHDIDTINFEGDVVVTDEGNKKVTINVTSNSSGNDSFIFDGYDSTGGVNILPTPSPLTIDTTRILDSAYSLQNNIVTFEKSGTYKISARFTSTNDDFGGNQRTTVSLEPQINTGSGFANIPGTRCGDYMREQNDPYETSASCSTVFTQTVQTGDQLRLMLSTTFDTTTKTDPGGSGLFIEFIR